MNRPEGRARRQRLLVTRSAKARRVGLHCSFCGRHQHDAQRLIAGPGVYICDECVVLCAEIVSESGDRVFRVAALADGGAVRALAYGPLEPGSHDSCEPGTRWLDRCRACGTWNVGAGVTACLRCGSPLRPRRHEAGGSPQPGP